MRLPHDPDARHRWSGSARGAHAHLHPLPRPNVPQRNALIESLNSHAPRDDKGPRSSLGGVWRIQCKGSSPRIHVDHTAPFRPRGEGRHSHPQQDGDCHGRAPRGPEPEV
jgi:hypothetical protein